MHLIRQLDQKLINQIAAGEVVEGPKAVIKELIENSLDAQANDIIVEIRNGGKSFIRVRDNGSGMCPDQMRLSLERHATSKLPEGNLVDIHTFGFRGEALPAIASVSRFSLISKDEDSKHGWKIDIQDNQITSDMPHSLSLRGTEINVSELFYATPARLKFLKSDQFETMYSVQVFKQLALSKSKVSFQMKVDNLLKYQYIATDHYQERIAQVIGDNFFDNSRTIHLERDGIKICGLIGVPTYNKSQAQDQYFFVNGRSVRDRNLSVMVKSAYGDLIPKARYPVVCIFIEIPVEDVDVNVHPAKTEVRFRDLQAVKRALHSSIKLTLQEFGSAASRYFIEKLEVSNNILTLSKRENCELNNTKMPIESILSLSPENCAKTMGQTMPLVTSGINPSVVYEPGDDLIAKTNRVARTNVANQDVLDRDASEMPQGVIVRSIEYMSTQDNGPKAFKDYSEKNIFETLSLKMQNSSNDAVLPNNSVRNSFLFGNDDESDDIVKISSVHEKIDNTEVNFVISGIIDVVDTNFPIQDNKDVEPYDALSLPIKTLQDDNLLDNPSVPIGAHESLQTLSFDNDEAIENISHANAGLNLGIAKTQIHRSFILSETQNALFIVDQHAAHERINYEKLKLSKKHKNQQILAFPEVIVLEEDDIALLQQIKEELEQAGVEFEILENNQVIIKSVPLILNKLDLKKILRDLISNIKAQEDAIFDKIFDEVLASIACRSSIQAGQALSLQEMQALLDEMSYTPNIAQCNHGRPTYVKLERKDIERLFERR